METKLGKQPRLSNKEVKHEDNPRRIRATIFKQHGETCDVYRIIGITEVPNKEELDYRFSFNVAHFKRNRDIDNAVLRKSILALLSSSVGIVMLGDEVFLRLKDREYEFDLVHSTFVDYFDTSSP